MRKGKFLTLKIKKRKDLISGIVLDYRNGWVIIQRYIDYLIDGYCLIREELIEEYLYSDREKLATRILKKKYGMAPKSSPIELTNLNEMLVKIQKKHQLLQLDNKRGDAFDVVEYTGSKNSVYVFRELTVNAKWRFILELPDKEITVVNFDNDYLNSLLLLL